MSRRREGFTLIDVVLGVAILTITATGLIALLRQTLQSTSSMIQRDREARAAGMTLAAVAVRKPAWLDQRVGESRIDSWTLRVERESAARYRIALADTATGATVVETAIYHPADRDTSAAPQ